MTEFNNNREKCEYYGVPYTTYFKRLERGWTEEEALTGKRITTTTTRTVYDDLGNPFETIEAMCEHYNICSSTFRHRKERGLSLHECLNGQKFIKDHLGNEFATQKEMCKYHGVRCTTFHKRVKKGLSLSECLDSSMLSPINIESEVICNA